MNHKIKLIDSTYHVKAAKDILFSLINDKIRFLNQRIISVHERFGSDTGHLENRIKELRIELKELLDTLKPLEDEKFQIEIQCNIDLKIKEVEKVEEKSV